LSVRGREKPESLSLSAVSTTFFKTLGARSMIGRTLEPVDATGRQPGGAVISYDLRTRRFGRDPQVLRQVLESLDPDHPPTLIPIVSVMPPEFDFPRRIARRGRPAPRRGRRSWGSQRTFAIAD